MKLILLRHGETEWSRTGRHTGRTDVPLTDAGRDQARRAGARLSAFDFALVLVSPLGRARETAELAGLGDRAEVDADLVEWDYGEVEGRTTKELRAERPGWEIWRDGAPGGETFEQLGARADRAIARALEADGDVCLVAHGHFCRVTGARWLELPAVRGGSFTLGTAAICELGFERERRVVRVWNDTAHLRDH
jgi:broad specificity phosphatase PhoE